MRALLCASALGGFAQSLAGASGALLARQLGGSAAVAGLPQALLVSGSAVFGLLLSRLALHLGRRIALAAGSFIALVGSLIVMVGANEQSLPLVLVGCVPLGAGTTAVMLGRYAAADLVPEGRRAQAMGRVLVATTVGAVAGPNLLAPATRLAGGLSGPYVIAAIGFAAATAVFARGVPGGRPARLVPSAGWVASRPRGGALFVLGVSNLVMVSVMTMAPVQLAHVGGGLTGIGLIVSLHIAGMFAPAPLSGWLTDRIGTGAAVTVAGALLAGASAIAASGDNSMTAMAIGMILLGIGWNVGLVSGSALLTAGLPAGERPRHEAWGELAMGIAASGGGLACGPIMAAGGYSMLAIGGIAAAAVIPLSAAPARQSPRHSAEAEMCEPVR